jgi:hypothetical protein
MVEEVKNESGGDQTQSGEGDTGPGFQQTEEQRDRLSELSKNAPVTDNPKVVKGEDLTK